MANQKDQNLDIIPAIPPSEDTTILPLKKRSTIGGKTLPRRYNVSDSSDSSDSNSDDENPVEIVTEEFKKTKLQELQRKAYYSVLNAFISETSTISDKRKQIIQELMNEWEIPQEAFVPVTDKIEKDLLTPEPVTTVSDEKPLTKIESFNFIPYVPKSGSSWGSTDPEFFVGLWVSIRMSYEDPFEDYIIKEYDSKQEMHRLENTDPTKMMMDDDLPSWIDLREIPPADIKWQRVEETNFDVAPPYKYSSVRRTLF